MLKKITFGLFFFLCSALVAEELVREEITQKSQKSIFESKLVCNDQLNAGTFQGCSLELFHNDKPVQEADINIDGGMPEHLHGLSTSPKAVWDGDKNVYEIKGLKFSMPGKWLLKFKVNAADTLLKDQINMLVDVD